MNWCMMRFWVPNVIYPCWDLSSHHCCCHLFLSGALSLNSVMILLFWIQDFGSFPISTNGALQYDGCGKSWVFCRKWGRDWSSFHSHQRTNVMFCIILDHEKEKCKSLTWSALCYSEHERNIQTLLNGLQQWWHHQQRAAHGTLCHVIKRGGFVVSTLWYKSSAVSQ